MWLWTLLLFSSCSFMMGIKNPEGGKNSEYKVKYTAPGWTQKKDDHSDYVWENKNDGRILLSNSFCQEFQDQALDVLALKTFKTVDELQIENKNYQTFHDREAYRIQGKGKVDGVPVALILMNTRRNNCYFDFVSITPLATAQEKKTEFEDFLKSVEFK